MKAANALYLLYKAKEPANLTEAVQLHRRASDYVNLSDQALAAEAADLARRMTAHQAMLKKDYKWDAAAIAAPAVDTKAFEAQLTAPQLVIDAAKIKGATTKATLSALNGLLRDNLHAAAEGHAPGGILGAARGKWTARGNGRRKGRREMQAPLVAKAVPVDGPIAAASHHKVSGSYYNISSFMPSIDTPPVPTGVAADGPTPAPATPAAPLVPAPLAAANDPAPPLPASGMSPYAWAFFPGLLLVIFIIVLLGLKQQMKGIAPTMLFRGASAAATFTTGAAIVIERIIETGWTIFAANTAGSYWPMQGASAYVGRLVNNLNAAFEPFIQETAAVLNTAGEVKKEAQDAAASAQKDIANFRSELAELGKLGKPSNRQSLLLSAATAQRVQYLQNKYGSTFAGFGQAAKLAGSAVDGLQAFVTTFKDNPGRRIISICLGGLMGVTVTAVLRLDLFQALAETGQKPATDGTATLHIVLTGLLIGLGSAPTHEVIRLIQEAKETRKEANALQPTQDQT